MSQVSYDPDPDVIRELIAAGVDFSAFRFPDELAKLLGEATAPGGFPAPDVDAELKCPKCGFRFDAKQPTLASPPAKKKT